MADAASNAIDTRLPECILTSRIPFTLENRSSPKFEQDENDVPFTLELIHFTAAAAEQIGIPAS